MNMNLDQIRDWFVEHTTDWGSCDSFLAPDEPVRQWRHIATGELRDDHPIPATLDAIAGLMPPGWRWYVTNDECQEWVAYEYEEPNRGCVYFERSGHDIQAELLDRARLAWLAWEHVAAEAAKGEGK